MQSLGAQNVRRKAPEQWRQRRRATSYRSAKVDRLIGTPFLA